MNEQGLNGLDKQAKEMLAEWEEKWNVTLNKAGTDNTYTALNGLKVPKVSFPNPKHKLESLRFLLKEGDYVYLCLSLSLSLSLETYIIL